MYIEVDLQIPEVLCLDPQKKDQPTKWTDLFDNLYESLLKTHIHYF